MLAPHTAPNAKIPLVELPVAERPEELVLATATPQAVDVSLAYVYLLRMLVLQFTLNPIANMPLVLFPTAPPFILPTLAAPTPAAVEVQQA